ncbi:MAG: beta-ketoacyl synthase chain length factor [Methylococcales bacterium]|nr:beta-ketoacyl synthase chain length factor [Methylococcales bacterium]
MYQDFIVRKWSVWPAIEDNERDDVSTQAELLSSVPKMLKRRLSPLARIVFCAASQCISENTQLPTVFSSTHGELAKSFKMMEMIEAGEEISPTSFSLSVHNAIAGLFSMIYKNKIQTTVVAPGEEGIAAAFIEATGLLQEGEKEVLVVLYDEPLVAFYPTAPFQLSAENSCAVALRISKTGAGIPLRFSCLSVTGDDGEQPLQVPLLIRFLAKSQENLIVHTPRHSWSWEKR